LILATERQTPHYGARARVRAMKGAGTHFLMARAS